MFLMNKIYNIFCIYGKLSITQFLLLSTDKYILHTTLNWKGIDPQADITSYPSRTKGYKNPYSGAGHPEDPGHLGSVSAAQHQ